MARKTQGTVMYFIDPADDSVRVVGCVTNIDGINTTIEQIETTCLSDLARTYESGLATPGAASFGIQFDPADDSHIRLHQLKRAGTSLQWAIGFSDGTAPPTVGADSAGDANFITPATRSWITFEGFMNSFPFTAAPNTMWQSNVGIQISGDPEVIPKTA
jgi:hypothetical protein